MKRRTMMEIAGLLVVAMGGIGCAEKAASENTSEDTSNLISGETYESRANEACFYNADRLGPPTLCLTVSPTEVPHIWGMQVCKYDPLPQEEPSTSSYEPSNFINKYTWQVMSPPGLDKALTPEFTDEPGKPCSEIQQVDMRNLTCNVWTLLQVKVHSPSTCNETGCTYHSGGLLVRKNCFSYPNTAG